MISFDDFITKWNNKGCDWDGYYGYQCMDLYHQYNFECVGGRDIPAPAAKYVWNKYDTDAYDRISNSPTNFPQKGDIVIWGDGVGQYGHIAVCISADSMTLQSFDQNWPLGSVCHKQPHNYRGVLGWLRPKKKVIETTTPEAPPETPSNAGESQVEDTQGGQTPVADIPVDDPSVRPPDMDSTPVELPVEPATVIIPTFSTPDAVDSSLPEASDRPQKPFKASLGDIVHAILNWFKKLLGK